MPLSTYMVKKSGPPQQKMEIIERACLINENPLVSTYMFCKYKFTLEKCLDESMHPKMFSSENALKYQHASAFLFRMYFRRGHEKNNLVNIFI